MVDAKLFFFVGIPLICTKVMYHFYNVVEHCLGSGRSISYNVLMEFC